MKKGDVVFNEWHGIRRYGVIENTFTKEEGMYVPWTYAKVRWFNDETYLKAIAQTNALRNDGSDIFLGEYRVDKLKKININSELKTLNDISSFLATADRSPQVTH